MILHPKTIFFVVIAALAVQACARKRFAVGPGSRERNEGDSGESDVLENSVFSDNSSKAAEGAKGDVNVDVFTICSTFRNDKMGRHTIKKASDLVLKLLPKGGSDTINPVIIDADNAKGEDMRTQIIARRKISFDRALLPAAGEYSILLCEKANLAACHTYPEGKSLAKNTPYVDACPSLNQPSATPAEIQAARECRYYKIWGPNPWPDGEQQNVVYQNQASESLVGFADAKFVDVAQKPSAQSEGGIQIEETEFLVNYDKAGTEFTWSYDSGSNCDTTYSPLILDLENKGLQLSSPVPGVSFDIDGDGELDQISWPVAGTGSFLTLDKNADGKINNVNELFGDQTVGPDEQKAGNGFLALAKYDSNADGLINQEDKIFPELRNWDDLNADGITDAGELKSLEEKEIVAINLKFTERSETDEFGNQNKQRSTVVRKDGVLRMIFDIWFRKV